MAILQTDWAALQTAWIDWVETATGRNASWRDGRQRVGDPNPQFLLHIQNILEHGPGVVYEYDSGQDEMVPKVQRLLDIMIEVSCVSNDQVPGTLAQQEISKLRAKTALTTYRQPLEDAGIALMTSRDVASVPFEFQGWQLSQAAAEFVFSVHDIFQDTSLLDSYISTVNNSDNCVPFDGVTHDSVCTPDP